jgi:histidinol-phosphate aminotransferase
MRAVGTPYPVSRPSLIAAERRLEQESEVAAHVREVRAERSAIEGLLQALGARVVPSSANFVFARVADAERVRDGLAARGIAVRTFPARPELHDAVRIGCPADPASLTRLLAGLRAVLS